jgi:hypothetical protein
MVAIAADALAPVEAAIRPHHNAALRQIGDRSGRDADQIGERGGGYGFK